MDVGFGLESTHTLSIGAMALALAKTTSIPFAQLSCLLERPLFMPGERLLTPFLMDCPDKKGKAYDIALIKAALSLPRASFLICLPQN